MSSTLYWIQCGGCGGDSMSLLGLESPDLVEVANNGREAVEKFTGGNDQFDLIFMDIQMPEMDGIKATRAIREHEKQSFSNNVPAAREDAAIDQRRTGKGQPVRHHIPIIALTAHALKGDRK